MKTTVSNAFGVPNQFVIEDGNKTIFQSYNSIIVVIENQEVEGSDGHKFTCKRVTLGKDWNYSRTTSKYRSKFLNETTKETESKIKSGEYVIDNSL